MDKLKETIATHEARIEQLQEVNDDLQAQSRDVPIVAAYLKSTGALHKMSIRDGLAKHVLGNLPVGSLLLERNSVGQHARSMRMIRDEVLRHLGVHSKYWAELKKLETIRFLLL